MNDRLAPCAPTVFFVGADSKLVWRVGLQIVDDRVAGGAGLVDPLPVPLPVADCVIPDGDGRTRVIDQIHIHVTCRLGSGVGAKELVKGAEDQKQAFLHLHFIFRMRSFSLALLCGCEHSMETVLHSVLLILDSASVTTSLASLASNNVFRTWVQKKLGGCSQTLLRETWH